MKYFNKLKILNLLRSKTSSPKIPKCESYLSFLGQETKEFFKFQRDQVDVDDFLKSRFYQLGKFLNCKRIDFRFLFLRKQVVISQTIEIEIIANESHEEEVIPIDGNISINLYFKNDSSIDEGFFLFIEIYKVIIDNFYKSLYLNEDKRNNESATKQLFKITNETNCPLAIIDSNFNIVGKNDLFDDCFLKNKENSSNKILNLMDDYHTLNTSRFRGIINRVIHGATEDCLYEVIKGEGNSIMEWSFTPWSSVGGIKKGAFLKFKIKQSVVKNEEASIIKEDKKDRDTFRFILGMIGHEMRTPLNSIIGFSHLIQSELDEHFYQKKENSKEIISYNEKVSTSAYFIEDLINNYLDYTKLQDHKIKIDPHAFCLSDTIDDFIIPLMQDRLKSKREVQFKTKINPLIKKTVFMGDDLRIKQVILNFLSNSSKFTSKGQIELKVDPLPDIFKSGIKVEIKDTGCGVRKEDLSNIFKPYFTREIPNTLNREGTGAKGTGLGLAITKNFIALMGGEINIESELGVGTTIQFSLPLEIIGENNRAKNSYLIRPSPKGEYKDHSNNLPLLVAEDDDDGRLLIELYLKKMGHTFEVAKNGQEVIDKVIKEKKKYQVILMDIQMPMIDGYKATQMIRNAQIEIPIWALTAHALQEHQEKAKNLGMNGHIKKPINPKELKDILNSIYQDNSYSSRDISKKAS